MNILNQYLLSVSTVFELDCDRFLLFTCITQTYCQPFAGFNKKTFKLNSKRFEMKRHILLSDVHLFRASHCRLLLSALLCYWVQGDIMTQYHDNRGEPG